MSHDMTGYVFAPKLSAVMDELHQIFEAGKTIPIDYASLGANKAKFDAVCEEMYKGMFYAIADKGVKVEAAPLPIKNYSPNVERWPWRDALSKYRLLLIDELQLPDIKQYCIVHHMQYTQSIVVVELNSLDPWVLFKRIDSMFIQDELDLVKMIDDIASYPDLVVVIIGQRYNLCPALQKRAVICY